MTGFCDDRAAMNMITAMSIAKSPPHIKKSAPRTTKAPNEFCVVGTVAGVGSTVAGALEVGTAEDAEVGNTVAGALEVGATGGTTAK